MKIEGSLAYYDKRGDRHLNLHVPQYVLRMAVSTQLPALEHSLCVNSSEARESSDAQRSACACAPRVIGDVRARDRDAAWLAREGPTAWKRYEASAACVQGHTDECVRGHVKNCLLPTLHLRQDDTHHQEYESDHLMWAQPFAKQDHGEQRCGQQFGLHDDRKHGCVKSSESDKLKHLLAVVDASRHHHTQEVGPLRLHEMDDTGHRASRGQHPHRRESRLEPFGGENGGGVEEARPAIDGGSEDEGFGGVLSDQQQQEEGAPVRLPRGRPRPHRRGGGRPSAPTCASWRFRFEDRKKKRIYPEKRKEYIPKKKYLMNKIFGANRNT